jgi:hypothetical protein
MLWFAMANACFAAAGDGYRVGFASQAISVVSPAADGLSFQGIVHVEGTSTLPVVWFCLKGPGGEVTVFPAGSRDGWFRADVFLRFGPGSYTVWAGPSQQSFDGSIRFTVVNAQAEDKRYLAPSAYVDSADPTVVRQAAMLVKDGMSDLEKVRAVYDWVTTNIAFDHEAYLAGLNRFVPASQALREKKGMCREYSFLVAAMARALDVQARVVYGQATGRGGQLLHAWNEALIEGKWISLDATFGAGFFDGTKFVPQASRSFFDLAARGTHVASLVTYH